MSGTGSNAGTDAVSTAPLPFDLETKLHPPVLRPSLVPRAALLAIDHGQDPDDLGADLDDTVRGPDRLGAGADDVLDEYDPVARVRLALH